ncbi:MAG: hypothetical protein GPJ09_06925 [Microcystis aeruginosa SX13-01]|nr:hypothetical protein [Microcystis aeruginosa SX13-01]
MSAPILIATGSTAGGILQDFQRRRVKKLQILERKNQRHSSAKLKEEIDQLKAISTLVFDTDGTNAYVLNQPLDDSINGWDAGRFFRCPLPGQDLIESIEKGHQQGNFETIIPRSMEGLKSNSQGAGGTPPNGLLAFRNNEETIKGKIRNAFRRNLVTYSHTSIQEPLSVFLLGTGFGGTASGSYEWLKQTIWQIAQEMNLDINFHCIFLIPGVVNIPKDLTNSQAITFACLKEQSAISTGSHCHRSKKPGYELLQTVSTRYIPTIFISDTNNSQEPHGLSRENQTSMIAELLFTWIATPLGSRRNAQADDFYQKAATELSRLGEPKTGISAGFALIILGKERLEQYSVLKLQIATLSSLLSEIIEELPQGMAQAFVLKHRLLAGQQQTELADRLSNEPTGLGSQATPERVSMMINNYTQGLSGSQLATQGENQANGAYYQELEPADSWEAVIDERKNDLITEVSEDLAKSRLEILRGKGLTATRQFSEKLLKLLKHIGNQALDDNPRYEEQVTTANEQKDQAQTQLFNFMEQIDKQKGDWLYQILSVFGFGQILKDKINLRVRNVCFNYCLKLKNACLAEMKKTAHFAALDALAALEEVVQERLLQLQTNEDLVRQLRDSSQNKLDQLIAYSPNFECPNGLHLHRTEDELEASYLRLLPENSETFAINTITRSLLQQSSIWELLNNVESLEQKLQQEAQKLIQPQLEGLHVVPELRRRYPQEADLGRVLMQFGDRTSQEFIQLKDSADSDGLYVLRLLGIDQVQAGNLPDLVNQYCYDERRYSYEVRDTGDSDRIIFWQERHLFPYSDWKTFETAKDAYRQVSEQSDFEKLHPVVGSRYLITPGTKLSELDAKALIIRTWLLADIGSMPQSPEYYQINTADRPIPIVRNEHYAILQSAQGYRYSVEIISRFNCLFMEKGVVYLYERLNYLLAIQKGEIAPINRLDTVIAPFYTEPVQELLRDQLGWWEDNSVPQAMEWWGQGVNSGVGQTHNRF